MIFLIISWVFLLIAAVIAVYHLRNYHEAEKKKTAGHVSSTLSEEEKVIIYDLEVSRERRLAVKD